MEKGGIVNYFLCVGLLFPSFSIFFQIIVANLLLSSEQQKLEQQTHRGMNSIKEPVRLRIRETRTGRRSLYLDIYHKGRRKYEYLNLYLEPETSKESRQKNREIMALAETVRAKRLVEFRNGVYGFNDDSDKGKADFYDFMEKLAKDPEKRFNTSKRWNTTLYHLKNCAGTRLRMMDVDRDFCRKFARHLQGLKNERRPEVKLAQNTVAVYYSTFATAVAAAVRQGYIKNDPLSKDDFPEHEETSRNYLTIEELAKLMACDYDKNKALHSAFLFSCLTGLRKVDIMDLTWGEIRKEGKFTRIVFKQIKTGGLEYLDINAQAAALLGRRGPANSKVFPGFTYSNRTTVQLEKWLKKAGIDKKLTFHCARHTFAVMMLDLDTQIYTLSKLLGHRSIRSTEIYAKILDKKKQEAVASIPDLGKVLR